MEDRPTCPVCGSTATAHVPYPDAANPCHFTYRGQPWVCEFCRRQAHVHHLLGSLEEPYVMDMEPTLFYAYASGAKTRLTIDITPANYTRYLWLKETGVKDGHVVGIQASLYVQWAGIQCIYAYNNGKYPFVEVRPEQIYLKKKQTPGTSEVAETALITVRNSAFKVKKDATGCPMRFNIDPQQGEHLPHAQGAYAQWSLDYFLGEVL